MFFSHLVSKRLLFSASAFVTLAASSAHAAFSYTDNFSGSTLQGASSPSGNSTSYDFAGNKAITASIASGDLKYSLPASTSAIGEAQAVFAQTPITLASVGDYIKFTMNFSNTAGTPAAVYFGLYKSGGTVPVTDLNNGSMTTSFTQDATGNTQNWVGYASQLKTSSSINASRPAQTGTTNVNQELLGNGASSSSTYAGGTNFTASQTTVNPTLSAGTSYFESYTITLTAAGQYQLQSLLYQGTDATGTLVGSSVANDTTFLYNNFDALAFGLRETNSVAPTIDVSALSVTSNVGTNNTTPEPASLSLLGLVGAALVRRRRA